MRLQESSRGLRLNPRPVPLEPFGHQVAGQSSMLMLDGGRSLCKPLIPREHHLYRSLPPSLQPFTPLYRGVLYVRLEEGNDGSLNLWGYYPDGDSSEESDEVEDNIKVLREATIRQDSKECDKKKRDLSNGPSEADSKKRDLSSSEHKQADIKNGTVVDNRSTSSLGPGAKGSEQSEQTSRSPPHAAVRPSDSDGNRTKATNGPGLSGADSWRGNADNAQYSRTDSKKGCSEDGEKLRKAVKGLLVDDGGKREQTGKDDNGGAAQTRAESALTASTPPALSSPPAHFPSRPFSGTVVRLGKDGGYQVTAALASENKFLVSTAGSDHPPTTTTTTTTTPLSHTSTTSNNSTMNTVTTTITTATATSTSEETAGKDAVSTHPLNPWGFSLHTRLLDKMRKSRPSASGCPFMILENVVAGFARPCILDLKVGSRLHGDDASAKKVASQTRKCTMTTSRSLGLRLCGMQVYQETTGAYKSLDKFQGRTLSDATFHSVLRDFLHNGRRMRRELLGPILARLHALIHCLTHLNSFRFYASSLLIMYDGSDPPPPSPVTGKSDGSVTHQQLPATGGSLPTDCTERAAVPENVKGPHSDSNIKMKNSHAPGSSLSQGTDTDDAHVPSSSSLGVSVERRRDQCETEEGPPHGKLRGVETPGASSQSSVGSKDTDRPLVWDHNKSSAQASACDHKTVSSTVVASVQGRSASCECKPDSNAGPAHTKHSTTPANLCATPANLCTTPAAVCQVPGFSLVDVRMIDFAHTTHSGFSDKVSHEGPDMDYIWGLQNLTRLFTQLQQDQEQSSEPVPNPPPPT